MAERSRCPGHARHWFAVWGAVGLRSPVCVRCGAPNPRPLSAYEWACLDTHQRFVRYIGEHAGRALFEHRADPEANE